MRLFLALELDPRERRAICRATAPMRTAASEASWVSEGNLHLSIKFFGEQPDTALAELTTLLSSVAMAHQPFELRVSGLGAFPNLRAPRVVWMGVQQDPRLELVPHDELLLVGVEVGAHVGDAAALGADRPDDRGDL